MQGLHHQSGNNRRTKNSRVWKKLLKLLHLHGTMLRNIRFLYLGCTNSVFELFQIKIVSSPLKHLNLLLVKNKIIKLPFVTKNSKHLVGTSSDDLPALIEFTPL